MKLLQLENVSKRYDHKTMPHMAVDQVTFSIEAGTFTAVMGASGSGKSTLLNLLSTIDSLTDGTILYEGIDLAELKEAELALFRRKNLGFIFQEYNLLDTLTVKENIALSLTIQKFPRQQMQNKIDQIASVLKISQYLDKFPYEISGGQRQRCACARALVTDPKLILADEPTGALDSASAQLLMETLCRLNQDFHTTILMVTHDALAASYCDHILFMQDGKINQELYRRHLSREAYIQQILKTTIALGGVGA